MKISKKQSGITLIALVITIVVLIILASVAITLSLGENGIFKKTEKAKEDTLTAQNEESMQIAEATNSIDEIVGGSDREVKSTYSETLLWSGEGLSGNIELTNSIRSYNMIYFTYAYYNPGQANHDRELSTATYRPADIISQGNKYILLPTYDTRYVDLIYIDDTHMNIASKNSYYLKSIYGIKY